MLILKHYTAYSKRRNSSLVRAGYIGKAKKMDIKNIEEKIGYSFNDTSLLETALNHSSYANECKKESNERLEFLGDSVLSIIISDCIFKRLAHTDEGKLSKYRATLVCEHSLNETAKKIDLSSFIRLGKGEELSGGRNRPSIVSDAFEAVLGAIYLDGGIEKAREWVLNLMQKSIDDVVMGYGYNDYKTMLQEALQKGTKGKVTYRTVSEEGEDHNKIFEVEVMVDGVPQNRGRGKNKKEAEQDAAHTKLLSIGKLDIK